MKHQALPAVSVLALLASCATTAQNDGTHQAWTDRLIDPVSAPTQFESPILHTSVKPIAIHHAIPGGSIFNGGTVRVLAVQARYKVNDDLAIIATKDGYVEFDPDNGSKGRASPTSPPAPSSCS
ncbi:MAG: hypothetical protein IPJ77_17385 [Planctomycetes bacterium]|nr:hypothetical protein [Planctomycetota bacterium]